MFNNAKSINFRGGEVKQIVRTRDNVIIYQKEEEYLPDNYIEIEFTGTTFSSDGASSNTLTGDNIFIDYGDGNIVEYTGDYSHTYDSADNYTIKIYGVTNLGYACFKNCTGLTSISIPDSVTNLESYCFAGCTDLTSINIPDSVTSLENYCFVACTSLTSISIPNSVTSLGMNCFEACTGLTSISIPDSITNLGMNCFEDCTNLIEVVLNWSTLNTIKVYSSSWFLNTNANLKFIIPIGTTSLYLEKNYPSNLLIEDNCIEIKFSGDTFSTSTISSSPFTYTGDIFVDWGDNTGFVQYTSGQLSHTYTNSNNYTIKIYGNITSLNDRCFDRNSLTNIIIPPSVTSIGDNCFNACRSLTSINIPSSVTSIGDDCFNFCRNLTSITIPSSVTNIGANCFKDCASLTSINIPSSVTSIEDYCFAGCTNLTNITIPSSITSIGDFCFNACRSLTSITIPSSVTSIGASCFYGCTGLTSITIPSNVTSIENYCFNGCTSLTSITIPSNVTSIGVYCFNNCTNLTSINIPSSVTSIGDYCFSSCTSLTEITFNWNTSSEIITYNSNWFTSTSNNINFIIPSGTTALYIAKNYPLSISIDLTGTKSILSYADSEQCVLTATVLDSSDNPVEDVTVNLYNGSTLWDTLTTDSSGECSKTYSSAGSGDIVFTAEVNGTLVSKTYSIEDCLSTNWSGFITSSYASATINNGQLSFSNSTAYYGAYIFNQKPNASYSIELTYVDTSGGNFVFGLGFVNDNYNGTRNNFIANCYYGKTNNDYWGCLASGSSPRPVTGDVYRLEVYDDHIDTYKNDVLLKTCTPSDSPYTGRFAIIGTDSPRKQTWKDIKIKKIPTPKVDKDNEELDGEDLEGA